MSSGSLMEEKYDQLRKSMDRANYFLDDNQHRQALKDYVSAFKIYEEIRIMDALFKQGQYSRIHYENSEKIPCLFQVGQFLSLISNCCIALGKINETMFSCEKLEIITVELSKYEHDLEIEDFKRLKVFKENLNAFRTVFEGDRSIDHDFLSDDSEFASFQKSLNGICKLHILPFEANDSTASDSKINHSGDSSCFIATAAYQTSKHSDLSTFRRFRDRWLLTNLTGRKLVDIYYQFGPKAALYIEGNPLLQKRFRKVLELTAKLMRLLKITEF